MTIRALALKDHCKRKGPKRTITVSGEVGGAFTDLGTCGLNAFGAYQAVFDTTIGDKVYLLQIYIPKASWGGPGFYHLKRGGVSSEPNVTFTDGRGSAWDSAEGSEASSGQVVTNDDTVSGSVSASMLRTGGGGTEFANGSFVCNPG